MRLQQHSTRERSELEAGKGGGGGRCQRSDHVSRCDMVNSLLPPEIIVLAGREPVLFWPLRNMHLVSLHTILVPQD